MRKTTGFFDKNGKEIYDSDSLTDLVETDEGPIKSNQKVFWNQRTGSWYLDDSFKQDQSSGTELWMELRDFDYEVITGKKDVN